MQHYTTWQVVIQVLIGLINLAIVFSLILAVILLCAAIVLDVLTLLIHYVMP